MSSKRPRLMFLTSADSGLAHYVVHLWLSIEVHADPIFVTYRSSLPDELVQRQISDIHPLLDPEDPTSIDAVVNLARHLDVRYVNIHSGTRVKLYPDYFIQLLQRLRNLGIRIVLHMHDAAVHRAGLDDKATVAALGRCADSILVGSVQEAEFVRDATGPECGPVALMHHGPYALMDGGLFDRQGARELLGLPEDIPVVLFFGNLREEKRLDDLLEAFEIIQRRMTEAMLLVHGHNGYIGKPEWIKALENQPGVRLHIGYAPLQLMEALFKAADVIALPYERTAASGVLNLARGFNRPVVVSDRFEHASSINDVCGYKFPARNPAALADALLRVLDMPEGRQRSLAQGWGGIMGTENWSNAAWALWDACHGNLPSTELECDLSHLAVIT